MLKESNFHYCNNGHIPIYYNNICDQCPLCIEKRKYKSAQDYLKKSVDVIEELQKIIEER